LRVRAARTRILVFESLLTSSHVDLVGFTYVVEVKLVHITTHVLDFVDEVENRFVVPIKVTSDLNGRLRSYLLDDVEHLFECEAMLAEDRVCEIVEGRLAGLAPVLLSVLASGPLA